MAWCMHCLETKSFWAPACPHCTHETGFMLNFLFQIIGGIMYLAGMALGFVSIYYALVFVGWLFSP